ncbi:pachytene checkpoint protein 2 homolog [Anthonomus grandis grandis]|uniref:pachytene checkpoint protein 2 homolog n=1 Tax=Anthonomus grandis grandis TaxID=2921223 RepID=UPI002165C8ED|nr:pachytene checkpoint protein 2 homolog [Anthonomus grandis grandis]
MDTIDIEVALASKSVVMSENCLTALVEKYLLARKIRPNTIITEFDYEEGSSSSLKTLVHYVSIGNTNENSPFIDLHSYKINWNIFMLQNEKSTIYDESDQGGEEIVLATHLTLPSKELFSLWENLYYDSNIKDDLLRYARTMMTFANKTINPNIVCCNKVILLHGPPGTGKTSLCKALAQKLTITMKDLFSSGLLVEINSHSLFSRYFSESGKLVTKMFTKIKEMCQNEKTLICVLMDEVESLAHARSLCSDNEPSDSIRVVNSILTQIDQIKLMPNVLIFATSNMTETIDVAFVDRADIKQFLGLPSMIAIYKIYYSCLMELIRAKIINCDPNSLDTPDMIARGVDLSNNTHEYSKRLMEICHQSSGFSGRTLRKIPFLAHALYVRSENLPVRMDTFLNSMEAAVEREHKDKKLITIKPEKHNTVSGNKFS